MIRIDAEAVEKAKTLGLNISKICEEALNQAVAEETRPYSLIESDKVTFSADLFYVKNNELLGPVFRIVNSSEENLILDRIVYSASLYEANLPLLETLDKPIQGFKGVILKREDIPKGAIKYIGGELPKPSSDTVEKINIMMSKGDESIKGVIFADIFLNGKKGIITGKFEVKRDEKGDVSYQPLRIF